MFSPLLQSIIERENYPVLKDEDIVAFATPNEFSVLFISGHHERLVEVNDVAVILPELIKAFKGLITAAVIDRDSERQVQLCYRFNAFPTLVFLRRGQYLGTISRVLDWQDYLIEISDILKREPSEAPAFQFPEGCATPAETSEQPQS